MLESPSDSMREPIKPPEPPLEESVEFMFGPAVSPKP